MLASQILEKREEELLLTPRINKQSQRLKRDVQDLHDWHQKSKRKLQDQKQQLLKDELDELRRLRSASKTSKFNDKYLRNNKYYPTSCGTEPSPDGKGLRVEDRLTNYGTHTKKKIEQERKQRDQQLRQQMSSPKINQRSKSRKSNQKPFHERLYTPPEKVEFHCEEVDSDSSKIKGDNVFQTMDVIPYEMNKDQEVKDPKVAQNPRVSDEKETQFNFAVSPSKLKYTPLRSSRSPSASQSRSVRRRKRFGSKKPDYNQNYKQTFHKNVLLKEWQYLPLYDRQVLWTKQKASKTESQLINQELKEMMDAPFQPQLSPQPMSFVGHQMLNFTQRKPDTYAEIHKKKLNTTKSKINKDLYTSSPRNEMGSSHVKLQQFSPRGMIKSQTSHQIYTNLTSPKRNLLTDFSSSKSSVHHLSPSQLGRHNPQITPLSQRILGTSRDSDLEAAIKLGDDYYMRMYREALQQR